MAASELRENVFGNIGVAIDFLYVIKILEHFEQLVEAHDINRTPRFWQHDASRRSSNCGRQVRQCILCIEWIDAHPYVDRSIIFKERGSELSGTGPG